jgi:hypothetical protein
MYVSLLSTNCCEPYKQKWRCRDPSKEALENVAECGVLEKALGLVDLTEKGALRGHIPPTSFFLLMSTLTTCAAGSSSLAHNLLVGGLHSSLHLLLANSSVALANNSSTSAIKTQQQLCQVLRLLKALMPSTPKVSDVVAGSPLEVLGKYAAQEGLQERVAFMRDNPAITGQLADMFLPLLHQIYTVQGSSEIRAMVFKSLRYST